MGWDGSSPSTDLRAFGASSNSITLSPLTVTGMRCTETRGGVWEKKVHAVSQKKRSKSYLPLEQRPQRKGATAAHLLENRFFKSSVLPGVPETAADK